MSFEPTLIIRKRDLNSKKVIQILEKEQYCGDEKKEKVAEYLLRVNRSGTFSFDNVELVLCQPEYTWFNKLVRYKLTKLKVEFAMDI